MPLLINILCDVFQSIKTNVFFLDAILYFFTHLVHIPIFYAQLSHLVSKLLTGVLVVLWVATLLMVQLVQ